MNIMSNKKEKPPLRDVLEQALEDDMGSVGFGKYYIAPETVVPYREITDAYWKVAQHKGAAPDAGPWPYCPSRARACGAILSQGFAYLRGDETDPETGLPRVNVILWNAVALCYGTTHNLHDGRRLVAEKKL